MMLDVALFRRAEMKAVTQDAPRLNQKLVTRGEFMSDLGAILSRYGRERSNLIPLLQDVQEAEGYLSEAALDRIAQHLGLSSNDVYGVATFYAQFRFTPVGKHHVKVCRGTACHVRGSAGIMNKTVKKLGIEPGETTEDLEFSLEKVACFGSCALAPVVVIDDKVYGRMTAKKTEELIEGLKK
jgi:NADH-quinone oxidoreductase E subunit